MCRCSASSSVRHRGPGGGSAQGHAATWEHRVHLLVPACPGEVTVGGQGPRAEPQPKVIPASGKGVSKLQVAGADAAPVVSAECLLPDCLPCVGGVHPLVVKAAMSSSHSW